MQAVLIDLIDSFRSEHGVPESVYNATYRLLTLLYNVHASVNFAYYVRATDGVFYLCDDAPKSKDLLHSLPGFRENPFCWDI